MRSVTGRLTYANVIATLALFLALGGGAVWAAGKVQSGRLKPNSVTAGKIRRNAVTTAKIRSNAVTSAKIRANAVNAAKIRPGAVDFTKLAAGTNVIATAHGGPIPADSEFPVNLPLTGTTSFTPAAGSVDFLSVELKGENLAPLLTKFCSVVLEAFVNGSVLPLDGGTIDVEAFPPTAEDPSGLVPISGSTIPLGLASPGVPQTIGIKVTGSTNCAPGSKVSVALAVTQLK